MQTALDSHASPIQKLNYQLRFIHPDTGAYTTKNYDLTRGDNRRNLTNTIMWAANRSVELRLVPQS